MARLPPTSLLVLTALAVFGLFLLYTRTPALPQPSLSSLKDSTSSSAKSFFDATERERESSSSGHVIMPKLGNETAKAELGRATWKYFHTLLARFPEDPKSEESQALRDFVHLFARLYPCGECAEHFQGILSRYPPQVASRTTAAVWGCFVHNEVNKSLGKEEFDCAKIGEWYDCGCGDEEEEGGTNGKMQANTTGATSSEDGDVDQRIEIQRDNYMAGG